MKRRMVGFMARAWATWRRESRKHRSVLVLTLVALFGLTTGAALIAAGLPLLGEFIAGLAVPLMTMAVYLVLLAAGPWPDEGGGPGRGGDDDPREPAPSGPRGDGIDWERFEREFWAHVDDHALVG